MERRDVLKREKVIYLWVTFFFACAQPIKLSVEAISGEAFSKCFFLGKHVFLFKPCRTIEIVG